MMTDDTSGEMETSPPSVLDKINMNEWLIDRRLPTIPVHFVKANTAITDRAIIRWIEDTLTGRYSLLGGLSIFRQSYTVWFENPEEAVFFDLKWG